MTAPGVVVAVVTYRRPAELARLLDALGAVKFDKPWRVLVVDNDPAGSAAEVVEAASARLAVTYVAEPMPGIGAARNRAIAECRSEFIVFIDDDEFPTPDWLARIVAVQRRFDADIVAGPVLSELEGGAAWLAGGGFFDRTRRPTAEGWFLASSANLLLRTSIEEKLGPLFDVAFGLTGGSDTLLSLRARQAGLRMAWADDAEVVEVVPATRTSASWILRRAYRCGTTIALAETAVAGAGRASLAARLSRGAKGAAHAVVGTLKVVPGALRRGRAGALQGLRQASNGLGMIVGATGIRYVEYRRRPSAEPA